MPFISIQSIYKKVAAVVASIFWRTTNYLYDHTRAGSVGRPVISGDGTWLVTSSGGVNASAGAPQYRTGVRVYKRTGGVGSEWQYIQEIIPPGLSEAERFMGVGMDSTTMSKDGTRIFIETPDGTGIYVFARSGDVWSYESTIPESAEEPYIFKPANFNTTTGVDATNDIITTDTVHDFKWESIVRYNKLGGTADIGLVENDLYYWARPPMVRFANGAINTTSNYITATAHPFPTGTPLRLIQTGTDPDKITALTVDVVYYSRSLASNQFAIYPTATDAVNDTNRISLAYTGTWSATSWSFQSANQLVLYPTQTDASNLTNRIQLTSTGGETHTIYQGSRYYNGFTNGFQPRVHTNASGSRVCTANTKQGCLATITVWDRSGTVWTESARIPVRNSNSLDWDVAGSYWQLGDNDDNLTSIEDAISMSGDGNTIIVGSSASAPIYAAYAGVTSFTFVASNPLYGNKPTIEITGTLTFDRIRPGSRFNIEEFPTPSPVDGRYTVSAVETPTIISIDTALSSGTIVDLVDNPATLYLEFESMFAHIFHYNGSSWVQEAEFIPPTTIPSDAREFAQNAAAVNYDGTVVAVSDIGYPAGSDYGRVYVFEKAASVWSYTDELIGDPDVYQRLGTAIDITPDGNTVVVGAPWYSIEPTNTLDLFYPYPETYLTKLLPVPPYRYTETLEGTYDYLDTYAVGKTYMFQRTGTGSPYSIARSTYPVDTHAWGLYFGDGVSVTDDGKTVAIAAPETPLTTFEGSVAETQDYAAIEVGSVRIWEEIEALESTQPRYQAYYTESEWPLLYAGYSYNHTLSADGSTLAVCYMDRSDIDIYTTGDGGITWSLPYTIRMEGTMLTYKCCLNATGTKLTAFVDTEYWGDLIVVTFLKVGNDWIKQNDLLPPQILDYSQGAPYYDTMYYATFGYGTTDYNEVPYVRSGMHMSADGNTLFVKTLGNDSGFYFHSGTGVDSANDYIIFTYPHSFETGEYVGYTRTGFPNASIGLTVGSYYYVRVIDKYRISVHTSYSGAINNTGKVNLTSTGTQKQRIFSLDEIYQIRVYRWNSGASSWDPENTHAMKARKQTSSALTNAESLDFGWNMACSEDGNVLVTTTSFQKKPYSATNANEGNKRVQVYIYDRVPAPATFTPEWVTVISGGTGYSVNDILTVTGGTPSASPMQIRVTGVSSGVITTAVVETASTYTEIYSLLDEVVVTGGTGSDARLRVWWDGARYKINTATIAAGGSNYVLGDYVTLAAGTTERNIDPASDLTFISINSLSGTAAATISITRNSIYTSIPDPTTPAATVGDNGSGLTLNLTWKLADQQHENGFLWRLRERKQEFWQAVPIQDTIFSGNNPLETTYAQTPVAMSADGSVIVFGHNSYQHVYILERGPQTQDALHWTTSFWSPTALERTGFGLYKGLAISADGTTIAVGASNTVVGGNQDLGKVYVYKKINSNWKLVTTLDCPCQSFGERFGNSLSLNNDGSILTVGSIQSIKGSAETPTMQKYPAGRVDIYLTTNPGYEIGCALDYASTEYNEEALTVNPSVSRANMRIGDSVDIVGDGQRLIVGGVETRVYSNLLLDGNWILEQELAPPAMTINDRIYAEYGCAVKINDSNHDVAFVSAPKTTVLGNVNAGVVYVFERTGTSWTLRDTISAAVPAANAFFGADIGINNTGELLAVSTRAQGAGSTGEAYVYRYNGSSWTETKITPPHTLIESGAIACIEAPYTVAATVAFGGRDAAGQARVYIYSINLSTGVATLGYTYVGGAKDPTPIPFNIQSISNDTSVMSTGAEPQPSLITTDVPHGFTKGEPIQYSREGGTEYLLFIDEVEPYFPTRLWVEPISSTTLRLVNSRDKAYDVPWTTGATLFSLPAANPETHYLIPIRKYSAGCEKGTLSFGWTGESKLFLAIGDPTSPDAYGDSTIGQVDVLRSTNSADFGAGPWTQVQRILPHHIGGHRLWTNVDYNADIRFGSNVYFRGYNLAISSTNYTDFKTKYWDARTTFAGGAWVYGKMFADDTWFKFVDLIPSDQNMQYYKSVAISGNNSYAVLGGPYFYHASFEEGEIPLVSFDTDANGTVSGVTLISGGTNQWPRPGIYLDRERWNRRFGPGFNSDNGWTNESKAIIEYDVDPVTGAMSNLSVRYPGKGYTPNLSNVVMPTTFGSSEAGEWTLHLDKPLVGQAKILNKLPKDTTPFPQFTLLETFTPSEGPGFTWGANAHMSRNGNVVAVSGYSSTVDVFRRDGLGVWSLDSIDLTPYLSVRNAGYDINSIHLSDDGSRLVVATDRDFFTFDYIAATWTYMDSGCPIPQSYVYSRHLTGDGNRYIVGLDYAGMIIYEWNPTLYSTMGDSISGGFDDTQYFDGVGDNGTFTPGIGYNSSDIITLTDGTQIKVIGTDVSGVIEFFSIVRTSNSTVGTGPFAGTPTLTQQEVNPPGGTGFTLTIGNNNRSHWCEYSIVGKGQFTNVTIDNPGSGYTLGDQLTMYGVVGENVQGAPYNELPVVEVTSVGGSGEITGLGIINPGTYLNYAIDIYYLQSFPLTLVGGSGSGATAFAYGRNAIEEADYQGYANEFPYRVSSSFDGSVIAGTCGRWSLAIEEDYGQSTCAITYEENEGGYALQQINMATWNIANTSTYANHLVAMSSDGTKMCITNPNESSIYVFQYDGTHWNGKGIASYIQEWSLDYGQSYGGIGGDFGLDISDDGLTIAAQWDGYDKVIIWRWRNGEYIVSQVINSPIQWGGIGARVRLSGDGSRLMITTYFEEQTYIYEI